VKYTSLELILTPAVSIHVSFVTSVFFYITGSVKCVLFRWTVICGQFGLIAANDSLFQGTVQKEH